MPDAGAMIREIENQLVEFGHSIGRDFTLTAKETAGYALEMANRLTAMALANDPQFMKAAKDAAVAIALRASNDLIDEADAGDARFIGFVQGLLVILARTLLVA